MNTDEIYGLLLDENGRAQYYQREGRVRAYGFVVGFGVWEVLIEDEVREATARIASMSAYAARPPFTSGAFEDAIKVEREMIVALQQARPSQTGSRILGKPLRVSMDALPFSVSWESLDDPA